MNLDLSALGPLAGSLARAGLPALSALLGAVVPPPFDMLVKPAFAAVAWAMGVDPEAPTAAADVQAKVDADPGAAVTKLQPVEDAHKDAADELKAYLADVQDARSTEVELVKAGSLMQYGAATVSIIITLGYAGMCLFIVAGHVVENNLSLAVYGSLSAFAGTVVAFWLGTSQSTKTRTDQALTFAAKTPAPAAVRRASR